MRRTIVTAMLIGTMSICLCACGVGTAKEKKEAIQEGKSETKKVQPRGL